MLLRIHLFFFGEREREERERVGTQPLQFQNFECVGKLFLDFVQDVCWMYEIGCMLVVWFVCVRWGNIRWFILFDDLVYVRYYYCFCWCCGVSVCASGEYSIYMCI